MNNNIVLRAETCDESPACLNGYMSKTIYAYFTAQNQFRAVRHFFYCTELKMSRKNVQKNKYKVTRFLTPNQNSDSKKMFRDTVLFTGMLPTCIQNVRPPMPLFVEILLMIDKFKSK